MIYNNGARVSGILAMSRALGTSSGQLIIFCFPSFFKHEMRAKALKSNI